MTDGSGLSSAGLFASLDPDGSWVKMCQGCCQLMLDGSSELYSETWPRSGTMRSGRAYRRQPLAPRISETGCSYWLTPSVGDAHPRSLGTTKVPKVGQCHLQQQIYARQMWPTPVTHDATPSGPNNHYKGLGHMAKHGETFPTLTSRDWKSGKVKKDFGNSRPLSEHVTGQLNPTWVEWLMGFPPGWTDLEPSETP